MPKPEVTIPAEPAPTELQIDDLSVGDGEEATPGRNVEVHYVGVGWSNGTQFDASWTAATPSRSASAVAR